MGHKNTNAPLILKIRDIIFFAGQFRSQKSLGPLEISLKMAHYVVCPQKKITSRIFKISGASIVILLLMSSPCCGHRFWHPWCWLASPDVPFVSFVSLVLMLLFFLVLLFHSWGPCWCESLLWLPTLLLLTCLLLLMLPMFLASLLYLRPLCCWHPRSCWPPWCCWLPAVLLTPMPLIAYTVANVPAVTMFSMILVILLLLLSLLMLE